MEREVRSSGVFLGPAADLTDQDHGLGDRVDGARPAVQTAVGELQDPGGQGDGLEDVVFRAEAAGEGQIVNAGPMLVNTGKWSARAAQDKFVVREPSSESKIWWGKYNRPVEPVRFEQRGCGRSSAEGPYDLATTLADLEAITHPAVDRFLAWARAGGGARGQDRQGQAHHRDRGDGGWDGWARDGGGRGACADGWR